MTKTIGFGLAHFKNEGAPIHPDDCNCIWSSLGYEKQLKAYNDYYHLNGQNDTTRSESEGQDTPAMD